MAQTGPHGGKIDALGREHAPAGTGADVEGKHYVGGKILPKTEVGTGQYASEGKGGVGGEGTGPHGGKVDSFGREHAPAGTGADVEGKHYQGGQILPQE